MAMAIVSKIGKGSYEVEGDYDTIYVNMTADERGVLWHVTNTNDFFFGSFADLDTALEYAEKEADAPDESAFDEIGDGMTDAEADADALASAGWGCDEDY